MSASLCSKAPSCLPSRVGYENPLGMYEVGSAEFPLDIVTFNSFSAGGDLDGDLYFVTWNDDFRPRRDIHEPMDYPALEKKEKDGEITVEDMVEFYAEYIQCDSLGN